MRIVRAEDVKLKETPAGELFSVLVGRHKSTGEAKQQTVAIVVLGAGKASDPHFHKEREESYFFLVGQGIAEVGAESVAVKAGDLVFARPGEKHHFRNTGAEDLKYLVFTAHQWVPEDSHI